VGTPAYMSPEQDDVELWIADETVVAIREPWSKRLGRWSRRHKTAVAASVAVLLMETRQ
jgi:eukaryotic-like serine/threonine-protein kinase